MLTGWPSASAASCAPSPEATALPAVPTNAGRRAAPRCWRRRPRTGRPPEHGSYWVGGASALLNSAVGSPADPGRRWRPLGCWVAAGPKHPMPGDAGATSAPLAPLGGQRPEAGHGRGWGGHPSPWPQLWQGQYRAGRGQPCHYLQTRVVTGHRAERATEARGVKGYAGPGPAGCRLGVRSKARDSAIRDWRGSLGAVPSMTLRHLGHTRRRGRPTRSTRKGHPAMHPHDENQPHAPASADAPHPPRQETARPHGHGPRMPTEATTEQE